MKLKTIAVIIGLAVSTNILAETELERLRSEVDELNKKAKEWESYQAPKNKMESDVSKLNEKAQEWEEWKAPKTLVHLAGYADVSYVDVEGEPSSFAVGTFAPIFHYQFSDKFMLEAELEFTIDEAGDTDVGLDYLTIDWFMNDYSILVAGKFLSPLGQFRQNLHPSWINKMASAPVGFGHDQAAPNAEIGLMVRGGYLTRGSTSLNYAVYIGNGPTLEGNTAGDEIEMIETPGLNKNGNGKKTGGGRVGVYFPNQKLEFGLSAAIGKVSLRTDNPSGGFDYDDPRDYNVIGADLNWKISNLDLRGEFIEQEIGEQPTSTAPEDGKWSAWYLQASYQFLPSSWEAVLRYGEYDTPHASEDKNQSAIGVNYLFASNLVAKLNYESNDNPNDGFESNNRVIAQMAYGF